MLSSPSSSLASSSSFAGPVFPPLFRAKIDFFAVFDPWRGRMLGVRSARIESSGVFVLSSSRICARASVSIESLKVFVPLRTRVCSGRKWRKKKIFLKAGQEDEGEAFATDPKSRDVESEIYEFMRMSDKPMSFPTKNELIVAGRADLAEAAAALGGWLTFGWDVDGDVVHDGSESRSKVHLDDWRVYQDRVYNGSLVSFPESDTLSADTEENCPTSEESVSDISLVNEPVTIPNSEDHPSTPSSSGRSLETETADDGGIEGILSRLEKERYWTFSTGSRGKAVNGRDSWRNALDDPGDTILVAHKLDIHNSERNSKPESSESKTCFSNDSGDVLPEDGKLKDVNSTNSMPDMWRSWSLRRAGFSMADFEAAEIAPTDDRKILEDDPSNVEHGSSTILKQGQKPYDSQDGLKELSVDKNQIHLPLQHLEADLNHHLLQSGVNGVASRKPRENSIDELHKLSDVWEFQETEIMNARDKLRSIRAKLAVLEGKLSLDIMEAKKLVVEKQKRIDVAQKALLLLRTTSIVWPNSASEVLFTGSFDGWTRKIRMERSNSGIFSLQLRLYPGRYEIKFIVDGVWKVDPLRPVAHNNGHENNLLIVE